jgi:hypothetical protein
MSVGFPNVRNFCFAWFCCHLRIALKMHPFANFFLFCAMFYDKKSTQPSEILRLKCLLSYFESTSSKFSNFVESSHNCPQPQNLYISKIAHSQSYLLGLWLRSSVVSVLIGLITDMSPLETIVINLIFKPGSLASRLGLLRQPSPHILHVSHCLVAGWGLRATVQNHKINRNWKLQKKFTAIYFMVLIYYFPSNL